MQQPDPGTIDELDGIFRQLLSHLPVEPLQRQNIGFLIKQNEFEIALTGIANYLVNNQIRLDMETEESLRRIASLIRTAAPNRFQYSKSRPLANH